LVRADVEVIRPVQNNLSSETRQNKAAILRLAAKSAIVDVAFLGLVNEAVQTASKLGLYVRLLLF
jgi:hypothetical protein